MPAGSWGRFYTLWITCELSTIFILLEQGTGTCSIIRLTLSKQNRHLFGSVEQGTGSSATRQEVAAALGNITEDGVKYNIGKLQQYGRLKRENGRKSGSWVVIDLE